MIYITNYGYLHHKKRFRFVKAKSLLNKKMGAFYRGSEWQIQKKDIGCLGDKKVPIELYAEFMAWYLSEGSYSLREKGEGRDAVFIYQSEKKNFDNYEAIEHLLIKIGFKYYKGDDTFIIRNKSLAKQLSVYGKSDKKYVPVDIKNSPKEIIAIFLEIYNRGDGSNEKSFINGWERKSRKRYYTVSKRMADDLGELILKIGRRPFFYLRKRKGTIAKFPNGCCTRNHNLWQINECYACHSRLARIKKKEIPYNDFSYCVELEKNNTLWIRRNGKVVWCGNCRCAVSEIMAMPEYAEVVT